MKSPLSLLFHRLNSSSCLSLCSCGKCSSASIIFVLLYLILSNSFMSFLYWGAQKQTQHSGVTSMCWREWKDHLPPPPGKIPPNAGRKCKFFAARAQCCLLFNVVFIRSPRFFSAKLLSRHLAPGIYWCISCWQYSAGMPEFSSVRLSWHTTWESTALTSPTLILWLCCREL